MTPQAYKKRNKVKRNIKRAAKIKFELQLRNIKLVDIANELGISATAVWRSVYGVSTITRVDLWLERHIGHDFYNYEV